MIGRRVSIVGKTGSGKSTLGRTIGEIMDITHLEIDSLFWNDHWQQTPRDILHQKMDNFLDQHDAWVVDGNYTTSGLQDYIWSKAETVIWLDYPLTISMWRLTKRTFSRFASRKPLWNTNNRENLWHHFSFTDRSLYNHAMRQAKKHRDMYPQRMNDPRFEHIQFLHHQTPHQTQQFLQALRQANTK